MALGSTTLPSSAGGGVGTVVSVSNFPATQPVSGTVTANQGTTPWVDNLSQVGGASFSLGQQLAAASLPIVLTAAQITTLTPLSTVAVTQSTSPWVVSNGGTFAVQAALNAETTKVIGVVRTADGSGNLLSSTANALDINLKTIAASLTLANVTTVATVTNLAQMNGAALLMGNGATGTGSQRVTVASDNTGIANWGHGATGSAVPAGATYFGAQAINAEVAARSNGNLGGGVTDLVGKLIIMPFANKENFVSGTATATGTSAASVIAAQGVGVKIYITGVNVANTGATTSLITIQNDPTGSPTTLGYTINPAGGGSNITFSPPLVSAANKAVGWTPGSSSTTQYITITGYAGS